MTDTLTTPEVTYAPQTSPEVTDTLTPHALELEHFSLQPTGMVVHGDPTLEEWAALGNVLLTFDHGLQWCIGKWLNYGEAKFGELAAQFIDAKAWSHSTVTTYRWVESKVPPENRRLDLPFAHHQIVADLPVHEQRQWLEKAATASEAPWPVARLKQELAATATRGVLRYLLVIDCDDETQRERLASRLEGDGYTCKRMEASRTRAAKKAPTARKKRAGRPRGKSKG